MPWARATGNPRRTLIGATLGILLTACAGGEPAAPTPAASPGRPDFSTHTSANFVFRFTPIDATTIAATATAAESHHGRIVADLGLRSMARVTVTLYPDSASLRTGVAPLVGAIPSFASGLVTGPDAIHVLSPNLASAWSYDSGLAAIVHEFAHCVSLRVNPSIANNPRWLWETVALHEAGQVTDPRTLAYMRALQPPTLTELNRLEDTRIYEVGGLLGAFIVETWGQDALPALVRTNGDLRAMAGIDEATFLARWLEFTRRRYGY
jgi:hypothetical protein